MSVFIALQFEVMHIQFSSVTWTMLYHKTGLPSLSTFILPRWSSQREGIINLKNHLRCVPPTTAAVDVAAEQRLLTKASGWELKAFRNCRASRRSGKRRKGGKKQRGKVGTTSPNSGSCGSMKIFWRSASSVLLTLIRYQISVIYYQLSGSFPLSTLRISSWIDICFVPVKYTKQSWLNTCQSCLHCFVIIHKGGPKAAFTATVFTERANQRQLEESISKVWMDPQSGGVRIPNLPERFGEWAWGRHRPAIHERLCADLVIKLQRRVGSTREQRRKAMNPNALADFTQPLCQGKKGSSGLRK